MLNESGGVEPEYAISYTRRTVGMTENKDKYYQVFCKGAREYMELHPDCDVDHLPKYFIASENIDPFDRIKLQAIMQKHIDTAISSTINLAESATEELMERLYLEGWKAGLKGLTIFRNNCKKVGILTTSDPKKSNDHIELSRGEIIECSDDLIGMKRKLCSGCGSLHVLAYFDPATKKMMEVYLSKGSTGGCQQFMIGLSRTISLLCRAGVDVYTIKDQLDSTGSCPSYAVRSATKHDTSKGSCCPMAIGNALVEMYEEFQEDKIEESPKKKRKKNKVKVSKLPEKIKPQSSDVCPECGSALQHVGGCINCTSCGWSKCS